ncbi:hypothetical protein BDD12DRAFT_881583 [Trichophaea hybrida]|nr:hypothetical protein BDD12DRAFT_881583 [Trichophaea hybrida]
MLNAPGGSGRNGQVWNLLKLSPKLPEAQGAWEVTLGDSRSLWEKWTKFRTLLDSVGKEPPAITAPPVILDAPKISSAPEMLGATEMHHTYEILCAPEMLSAPEMHQTYEILGAPEIVYSHVILRTTKMLDAPVMLGATDFTYADWMSEKS